MDRKEETRHLVRREAEALGTVSQADGVPVAEVVRPAIDEHVKRRRKDTAFQERLQASTERNQRILEKLADQ